MVRGRRYQATSQGTKECFTTTEYVSARCNAVVIGRNHMLVLVQCLCIHIPPAFTATTHIPRKCMTIFNIKGSASDMNTDRYRVSPLKDVIAQYCRLMGLTNTALGDCPRCESTTWIRTNDLQNAGRKRTCMRREQYSMKMIGPLFDEIYNRVIFVFSIYQLLASKTAVFLPATHSFPFPRPE